MRKELTISWLRTAKRVVAAVVRVVLATAGAAAVRLVSAAIPHAVALAAPLEKLLVAGRCARRNRNVVMSGLAGVVRATGGALADMAGSVEERARSTTCSRPGSESGLAAWTK